MMIENQSHKAVFYGDAQDIPQHNPKLNDMWFVASKEAPDAQFLQQLERQLGQAVPPLMLEFISQCGGFDVSYDYSYPCAHNDKKKSLQLHFEGRSGCYRQAVTVILFEGFYLPGSSSYHQEMSTLQQCFADGDYDDELQGRDWQKLLPFASDNGDILCLDFNTQPEPGVVYISYDGVEVFPAFNSFRELLLALDYKA